jgi:predicted PurR-regulated permease PerM
MKKYLAEIHTKSPKHKRRFALVVSLGVTLIIFGVWMFVKFSDLSNQMDNTNNQTAEITPINNLTSGIANSLEAIKSTVGELKNAVNPTNLQNQYNNMKNQALPADSQNVNIDSTSNTNGQ